MNVLVDEDNSRSISTEDHDMGMEKSCSGDKDPYADEWEHMSKLEDQGVMNHAFKRHASKEKDISHEKPIIFLLPSPHTLATLF
eukprot:1963309-Ditylum_brightwellii.AAC.1